MTVSGVCNVFVLFAFALVLRVVVVVRLALLTLAFLVAAPVIGTMMEHGVHGWGVAYAEVRAEGRDDFWKGHRPWLQPWHYIPGPSFVNHEKPYFAYEAIPPYALGGDLYWSPGDRVLWRYRIATQRVITRYPLTEALAVAPVVGDGILFVATKDGMVSAWDVDGTLKWRHELSSHVVKTPVWHGGALYVVTVGGEVVRYHVDSGQVQWIASLHHTPQMALRSVESITLYQDRLYVGGRESVEAFSVTTGQLEARYQVPSAARDSHSEVRGIVGDIVVSADGVLFSDHGGRTFLFYHPTSSLSVARMRRSQDMGSSITAMSGNLHHLFLGTRHGEVVVLDPVSGVISRRLSLGHEAVSSIVPVSASLHSSYLIATLTSGQVAVVDVDAGTLLAHHTLQSALHAPAVFIEGQQQLWLRSGYGNLYGYKLTFPVARPQAQ